MAIAWSSPAATCVAASGSHHVALVVQHGDGSTVRKCISFSGASLTGEQVLQQSGVEYRTVDFGGLSAAVCQVDGEPASFPASCWSGDSPFWELFIARKGGAWAWASLGISAQVFHDGDAEGFRYEAQTQTIAPTSMGNCPTATPTPAATPKPTSKPTQRPTAGSTTRPVSTPTASGAPAAGSAAPLASGSTGLAPTASTPPVDAVGGMTSGPSPTGPEGSTAPPGPAAGTGGNDAPALALAVVAIVGLAGLAVLRRRPRAGGRPR